MARSTDDSRRLESRPARPRQRLLRRALIFSLLPFTTLAALISGCATVTTFNALVPKDGGGDLAASDIAFGDHPRLKLDVYRPESGDGRAPVVLFVYGGSWDKGRRQDYAFVGRALAARGFVTVIADYRLVPEIRFPAFLEDNARAVRWVRDNIAAHGGDVRRLFLLGHSAGAYNVAMLALDPRWLAAVGLSPAMIRGVAGLSGPYDFLPLDTAATIAAFSSARDLPRTQPINFAHSDAPPMFLATGDEDTTVRPKHTRAMAAKLRSLGAAVTERVYPGIGHAGMVTAFARPFRGRAAVLEDVAGFFAKL